MLEALQRQYVHLITSGAQVFLLLFAMDKDQPIIWMSSLGAISIISLFAGFSALYRLRAIRDTPISRIGSAAQGYAELAGLGKTSPDQPPVLTKRSLLPCLWRRCKTERKSGGRWYSEACQESETPFVLDDGTGQCVIDPCGAEIMTSRKDTWKTEDYRHTEWTLLIGDALYATGEFRTFGGRTMQLDINQEVSILLSEWKKDMPGLYRRFDLDNDGKLNEQEWMLARHAAKREALERMEALRAQPDTNYLRRPSDGRLFLISNLPRGRLEHRYLFWTLAHLAIFIGAIGGMGWIMGHPASSQSSQGWSYFRSQHSLACPGWSERAHPTSAAGVVSGAYESSRRTSPVGRSDVRIAAPSRRLEASKRSDPLLTSPPWRLDPGIPCRDDGRV